MGSHKQLVEPVSVGMASPPFRTTLDQLKFVHQINVIFVQRVRRVGDLATSLGISNQFVVIHVSNLPAIIVLIHSWSSHLFYFLGRFTKKSIGHRFQSLETFVPCAPRRLRVLTRRQSNQGFGETKYRLLQLRIHLIRDSHDVQKNGVEIDSA
jgi:hypothetical protein